MEVVTTDSAVSELSVAHRYLSTVTTTAVTTLCSFSPPQRCTRFCCHSAVLVFIATTLYSFLLSQCCARFHRHNTVLVFFCHSAVLVFIATTLYSFLLSQSCARFHRHNTVLVFAVTELCSFSSPQHCTRLFCHSAVHNRW